MSGRAQEMEVEESKPYLTINTTRGLYQYQRLPYGVASAPAIWQCAMDQVLQGITHTVLYASMDDIIVTGKNKEEHLRTLNELLQRLEVNGLKANKEKSKFLKDFVEYLGYY
jgi:acetyl/propionyl-CoA carboxylase alpha subunit